MELIVIDENNITIEDIALQMGVSVADAEKIIEKNVKEVASKALASMIKSAKDLGKPKQEILTPNEHRNLLNNTVAQKNDFLKAIKKASHNEIKLVMAFLSQINTLESKDKNNPNFDINTYLAIRLDEARDLFHDNQNRQTAEKALISAGDNLANISMAYENERYMNWHSLFHSVKYDKQEKILYARFHDDLQGVINELGNDFTRYKLFQIKSLTSNYAIRLFEFFTMKWNQSQVATQNAGNPKFELQVAKKLDWLHTYLNVPKSYKKFSLFRGRAIDPAIKQISEKTDLNIRYNIKKNGKKVCELVFFVSKKIKVASVFENQDTKTIDWIAQSENQECLSADDINVLAYDFKTARFFAETERKTFEDGKHCAMVLKPLLKSVNEPDLLERLRNRAEECRVEKYEKKIKEEQEEQAKQKHIEQLKKSEQRKADFENWAKTIEVQPNMEFESTTTGKVYTVTSLHTIDDKDLIKAVAQKNGIPTPCYAFSVDNIKVLMYKKELKQVK